MKQITLISGKNGTGKTSLTAAFAAMVQNAAFADCDVDAADLHIIFTPNIIEQFDFVGNKKVVIQQEECIRCALCHTLCRFSAIDHIRNQFYVREFSCQGCDLCRKSCPVGAIEQIDRKSGDYFISDSRFGLIVHAQLGVGEDFSGKLVTLVRENALKVANQYNKEYIIIDGPPGIGNTAMSSINGVDLALIIAEPTQSSLHNLKRMFTLTTKLAVPAAVIINKSDLNPEMTIEIINYCQENKLQLIAEVPYDRDFTYAMFQQKSLTEYKPESPTVAIIERAWNRIQKQLFL